MGKWVSRFFGVVARPGTWLNVAYLWLAFPLGLFYFIFLTVGLSLGFSLVVIWIGIPVLLVVVGAWWLFAAFERAQAEYLLGVEVAPSLRSWELYEGVWAKLKGHFAAGSTWRDLLFLTTKLPVGIVCFVLSIFAMATTAWLLALPIFWYFGTPAVHISADGWVPPLWAALLGVPAGVLAFFAWLHAVNAAAWVCGQWALLVFGSAPPPVPATGMAPAPSAAATAAQPSAPDSWTHETSVEHERSPTLNEGERNES